MHTWSVFHDGFDVILQFNRKQEKGIEFLISSGLVESTPASVAQFLRNTANLDKVTDNCL